MAIGARPVREKGEQALENYKFYMRFTEDEMINWIIYANNTANSPADRARADNLRYLLLLRPLVNLSSSRLVSAVNWLESTGIIGTGRAAEILQP